MRHWTLTFSFHIPKIDIRRPTEESFLACKIDIRDNLDIRNNLFNHIRPGRRSKPYNQYEYVYIKLIIKKIAIQNQSLSICIYETNNQKNCNTESVTPFIPFCFVLICLVLSFPIL